MCQNYESSQRNAYTRQNPSHRLNITFAMLLLTSSLFNERWWKSSLFLNKMFSSCTFLSIHYERSIRDTFTPHSFFMLPSSFCRSCNLVTCVFLLDGSRSTSSTRWKIQELPASFAFNALALVALRIQIRQWHKISPEPYPQFHCQRIIKFYFSPKQFVLFPMNVVGICRYPF